MNLKNSPHVFINYLPTNVAYDYLNDDPEISQPGKEVVSLVRSYFITEYLVYELSFTQFTYLLHRIRCNIVHNSNM